MKTALTACLSLGLAVTSLHAQSAETPPVGFNTVLCKSGSDTFVSVAFNRPTVFVGLIATANTSAISVQGNPNWQNNEFVGSSGYFVKIRTGAKAGAFYEITANSSSSIDLDLAGDTLSGVLEGDQVAIHPYWTLNDLLPVGNTTIHQSLGVLPFQIRTQVLFPNLSGSGVNLTATGIYFLTSQGWRNALDSNNFSNPKIEPDQYIIIRHRSTEPDTQFIPVGAVDMHTVRTVLATRASGSTDNPVSNARPVPVKLKDLGLISSGAFTPSAGTLPFQIRDTLLVFNNDQIRFNKPASNIYFYNNATGNWMDSLDSNRVANDDVILPSTGFVIRKFQVAGGASSLWKHDLVTQ